MEMCDRNYMFGDKSKFGSIQNGQKRKFKKFRKINKKKYVFCTLNKGQLPIF